MEKLRTTIIGCGNIFTMHSTSVANLKNVELVGVCDIKKDRADAAAKKYNTKAFYDYKEMLDTLKPDIVHVCVPHYLHPIISRYALEKGINVLCEKPMCIKYEDGIKNIEIAEKNNILYGIIFQCRYNDASVLVKKALESGKLGKVISARCVLTWCKPDSYYSLSDWKGTWDKEGGGVIIDQAIHSLDLANWFINDEPVTVQASLYNRNHEIMEVDDCAEGFIKYKNGATLSFWAMNNYGCDEDIEIRLCCENGKATLSYDDATITYNDGTVEKTTQDMTDALEYENGKDYWGFQHYKQIKQFYESVRGNERLEISAKEALKIQKLVCAIYDNGSFTKKSDNKI
ncbi:MAG: Gfo/Idh/MocA family oxidoreductase [Ruminococcaceae bacterium]|nr:Gfo/Idh/MocA family oxidoreductase [Oscillospiraceae bacterium]